MGELSDLLLTALCATVLVFEKLRLVDAEDAVEIYAMKTHLLTFCLARKLDNAIGVRRLIIHVEGEPFLARNVACDRPTKKALERPSGSSQTGRSDA